MGFSSLLGHNFACHQLTRKTTPSKSSLCDGISIDDLTTYRYTRVECEFFLLKRNDRFFTIDSRKLIEVECFP